MKNFGKYLSYRLKKALPGLLAITVICTVLVAIYLIDGVYRKYVDDARDPSLNDSGVFVTSKSPELNVVTYVIFALAYALPVLENCSQKSRRQLDITFSLPVSRVAIGWGHYLSGAIQLVFSSAAVTLSAAVITVIFYRGFAAIYIIPFYFSILAIALMIYSVTSFLFAKGNSLLDGILTALLFPYAIDCIFTLIGNLVERNTAIKLALSNRLPGFSLFSLANMRVLGENITHIFEKFAKGTGATLSTTPLLIKAPIILWSVCALLATIGFVCHFKRYRAETAGDISDSLFSYRFIIPVIGIYTIYSTGPYSMLSYSPGVVGDLITVMFMLIGYFIYRKSFHIKFEDIATVLIALAVTLFK